MAAPSPPPFRKQRSFSLSYGEGADETRESTVEDTPLEALAEHSSVDEAAGADRARPRSATEGALAVVTESAEEGNVRRLVSSPHLCMRGEVMNCLTCL